MADPTDTGPSIDRADAVDGADRGPQKPRSRSGFGRATKLFVGKSIRGLSSGAEESIRFVTKWGAIAAVSAFSADYAVEEIVGESAWSLLRKQVKAASLQEEQVDLGQTELDVMRSIAAGEYNDAAAGTNSPGSQAVTSDNVFYKIMDESKRWGITFDTECFDKVFNSAGKGFEEGEKPSKALDTALEGNLKADGTFCGLGPNDSKGLTEHVQSFDQ